MTKLQKNIAKWIEALRSGKYKQTKRKLQDENGYCCLGVACDVFIPKDKQLLNDKGFLIGGTPNMQPNSPEWLNSLNTYLSLILGTSPIAMNDNLGMTFDEIADVLQIVYIEELWELL